MIVLVLTACPLRLRGFLTRWLLEVSSGVYVGRLNPRLRDAVWDRVKQEVSTGRALMVFSTTDSEQGFGFRTHRHDWAITDHDGLMLVTRPAATARSPSRTGWSKASRNRKFRR